MGTAKKVGGSGDEEGSVMKDFWRNDYDRICQENADRLDGVSEKNRVALIRMFQYVAAFPVSLFKKKSRIVFLCYAIIVLFYVGWISIGMKGIVFFPGHGWLIFVILLAAETGAWFINCRYWNRCSAQYDWK